MNTSQKRHKAWKLMLLGVGLLGIGSSRAWAGATADATITVTPVANVLLQIAPTTYAYGSLNVGVSSITATALTLSNTGQVNVTVTKQITNQSNPSGWTAGVTQDTDTYRLYCATSTARPSAGDFVANGAPLFGALNNSSNLTGSVGTQPSITIPGGALPSVNLWFRLDMPTVVTSQAAREITVRFTGTAQ